MTRLSQKLVSKYPFSRSGAMGGRMVAASEFDMESSKYMGIDAVKKLRLHFNINKVGELSISPSFFLFPHRLFLFCLFLLLHTFFSLSLPHLILLSVLPSFSFHFLLLSLKPFSPLPLSFIPYRFLFIAGNCPRSRIAAADNHSEGTTIHITQHTHSYYKMKQCC